MSDPRHHFSDHFDGTLSEEGRRELNEYIKSDPRHAKEFIAAAFLHTRLREKFRGWNNSDSSLNDAQILPAITDEEAEQTAGEVDVFAQAAMKADRLVFKRKRNIVPAIVKKTWPIAAGLLAALIGVGVWHWAANRPVATLVREVDARWATPNLSQGSRVRGELQLQSGLVEVAFDSGASVVLQGPALARLTDASHLELLYGKLTTNVPHQAIGFTVSTGRASVVDLGTEIGIDAREDRPLHVEVFKGKAAVEVGDSQKIDSERKVLTDSMAVAVADDGQIHDTAAMPLAFVRTADVEHRAEHGDAAHEWKSFSERVRRDPSVIAYYPFDNAAEEPTRLFNRMVPSPNPYDGSIFTAEWDAARTSGHQSLHFQTEPDHVVLNIPGAHANFSAAEWVRVAPAQTPHVGLLMSTRFPHEPVFHWQVGTYSPDPPEMYVITTMPEQANKWSWHGFRLPPDFFDDKWHLVAFSFEGQTHTIRVYLDGAQLGSPQVEPTASTLTIGDALIGNLKPNGKDSTEIVRGNIDELVIWDRVVSEDELAAMYVAGNVK